MPYETERLRERMLDLERSSARERALRLQAESLLAGLMPLARAEHTTDIFLALIDVLRKQMDFEEAALVAGDDEELRAVASTSAQLAHTRWRSAALFQRVLSGEPASIFDVRQVPEWQEQSPELIDSIQSALHIPLRGTDLKAMLICTHSGRGAFTQAHVALARQVGPLAAQALRNIEQRVRERAQLQREREQQAGFRLLIENLPDAIWVTQNGAIRYANHTLVDMLGFDDADDVTGLAVNAFVYDEDIEAFTDLLESPIKLGGSRPFREIRLQSAQQTLLPLEVIVIHLSFDGEPARICVGRDIRERKKLTSSLMQVDRMIAAGTLAAGVGHEINNPLTFLLANVYLAQTATQELGGLLIDSASEERQLLFELEKSLGSIDEGASRIADVVRELRVLSPGVKEQDVGPVELLPLIESAKRMVCNRILHRARFTEELQPVPKVFGSYGQLAQVIMNLLDNAALSIAPGATEDNEVRLRNYEEGSFIVVEVSDTG
ncbi:MAG: PAS domain S-box protein, partial [Bradymonadaceae bacterium]